MVYPDPASLQASLNRASPDHLPDHLRALAFGDLLAGHMPLQRRKVDPVANSSNLATVEVLGLPKHIRASAILRAYARATSASGTLGELAAQAANTTPADAQIAVTPNGEIAVLASSAYTDIDVTFVPACGEVIELPELPVATNALTIPSSLVARGVIYLLDATATVGSVTGACKILAPSASAATTGTARLDLAKATVKFYSSDAVTAARVSLFVVPKVQLFESLIANAATT